MTVLKNIIDKKRAGKLKIETEKVYYSELLDEEIKFTKKPLSVFLQITADHGVDIGDMSGMDLSALVPLMNDLIFQYADMFKNPDDVKAAKEFYEAPTPRDLPELVFEGDMKELGDMFALITEFYVNDVEEVRDDIKN